MNPEPVKKNVVVTRVLDAPVEAVWEAWSEQDYVMQWWGPVGFSSPSAKMDFREGGISLVHMRASEAYGGMDYYNTRTYEDITPMEQIKFIQSFSDEQGNRVDPSTLGMPPGTPQDVHTVVLLKPLNDHQTEMNVTEYVNAADQILEMSQRGLEECLDKMVALFTNQN
jgi:uncharacterized protein YndB with AHSA1/START domain